MIRFSLFPWSRPRRLIALGAGVLLAALGTGLMTPGGAAAAVPDTTELAYYDVTSSPSTTARWLAADLARRGYDVLEGPLTDGVPILATAADTRRLRGLGLTVRYAGPLYQPVPASVQAAANTFYGGYHTVAGHEAHDQQVATAHPDLAVLRTIGRSWLKSQGRGGHDIQALCITKITSGDCALNTSGSKPKFTLMAQMHARELATGELAYRWIDYLVGNYGTDTAVTRLMDTTELWVIPIANPDGVDIVSSNSTRPVSQRKNAHDNGCTGTGLGVDLNRNSSYHWDVNQGTRCSETYPGAGAASEPETQGIQTFLSQIYRDTKPTADFSAATTATTGTFLTLHSYAELNIYPYGWTNSLAPNNTDLRAMATTMSRANGYDAVHGDGGLNYFAPGATDDWIYGTLGVPGFTIEVGPNGSSCSGFFPQYSCMTSFWNLNLPAFMALGNAAAHPYPTGG
ncbi:M14 family zinc carboxypeptidase [Mangrovihabitans endophyticus]|uniref:Zinc carboxypeptidase n=1 Tax=Mangrovihabitans endophyticus TaxID=1751298 RepID=A0A8J3FNQ7_9ACTN|nr:M14 family zinc carboxypeptidase [Mangrovihabitans endophyticus]GGK88942.1 peptidase M14 [Mangrovihabitans endophyticus]